MKPDFVLLLLMVAAATRCHCYSGAIPESVLENERRGKIENHIREYFDDFLANRGPRMYRNPQLDYYFVDDVDDDDDEGGDDDGAITTLIPPPVVAKFSITSTAAPPPPTTTTAATTTTPLTSTPAASAGTSATASSAFINTVDSITVGVRNIADFILTDSVIFKRLASTTTSSSSSTDTEKETSTTTTGGRQRFVYDYEGVTGEKMDGVETIVFMNRQGHGNSGTLSIEAVMQNITREYNDNYTMYEGVFTTFDIDDNCFEYDENTSSQWFQVNLYAVKDRYTLYEVGFKAGRCQTACQYLRSHGNFWMSGVNATGTKECQVYPELPFFVNETDIIAFDRNTYDYYVSSIKCNNAEEEYVIVHAWVLDVILAFLFVFLCCFFLTAVHNCLLKKRE